LHNFAQHVTTQANRWKTAFFILLLGALCAIGYLALQLFDQSATLSLIRDHSQRMDAALSVLCAALPDASQSRIALSQEALLAILRKRNPGVRFTVNQSVIEMDQIRFCFAADGSLDRIERTDDYGTRAAEVPP
jgi:hypothetical protein